MGVSKQPSTWRARCKPRFPKKPRRLMVPRQLPVRGRLELLEARHLLSTEAFWAGINDDFALPTESPSPCVALEASDDHGPSQDFDVIPDVGTTERKVAHTFRNLLAGIDPDLVAAVRAAGAQPIRGATLTVHAKAGSHGAPETDGIALGFHGSKCDVSTIDLEGVVWSRKLQDLLVSLDLVQSWTTAGEEATVTLDLSALPQADGSTRNLIPLLNEREFLDVRISDDTGVDYYKLNVDYTAIWDGGGDGTSWSDPDNWVFDKLPQAGDDVFIPDVAATSTVRLSSGDWQIANLVSAEAFTLAGGSLEVAATVQVNNAFMMSGGTLADAQVLPGSGGQSVRVGIGSARVRNVTMDADLDFPDNATYDVVLQVDEGMTLNGTATLHGRQSTSFASVRRSVLLFNSTASGQQRLDGTGTIVFNFTSGLPNRPISYALLAVEGDTRLTIGPGITLRGERGHIGGHYIGAGTDTIVNRGSIVADVSGNTLVVQPDVFTNEGTLEARNSGALAVNPLPTNFADGTLTGGVWQAFAGSLLRVPTAVQVATNAATIILDGAGSRFENAGGTSAVAGLAANTWSGSLILRNGRNLDITGPFANAGATTIGSGSELSVSGNYTQTAGSTVVDGTLSAAIIDIQVGMLGGGGTIDGSVINAGAIDAGASPGVLTVDGDYAQTADGLLNVELGGTLPGQFDQLNVTGAATLDGTLNVSLFGGFAPTGGDVFPILTYGSRAGDFADINGLLLAGGGFFTKQLNPNDVTLLGNVAAEASIDDLSIIEGDDGSTGAVFTVTLDKQSPHTITIDYATADGNATAGSDYTNASGTLTFAPGATSQTITVPVLGDTLDEPDETFTVELSGAANATISDGQGVGTITDDDVSVSPLLVTNTNDNGPGSLRNAIEFANTNPGSDTITFNIPVTDTGFVDADSVLLGGDAAPDVFVIRPLSALPALNDSAGGTAIDGRTQAIFGDETNPFGPEIVLDGNGAGDETNGLTIRSAENRVVGLNIQQFDGGGIWAETSGAQRNWIAGNYVGTDATGTMARPNTWGIVIQPGANNNVVGTDGNGAEDDWESNLVSGNVNQGVLLNAWVAGVPIERNVLAGNRIGTDATGTMTLGNGTLGVQINGAGARFNRIGTDGDGISDGLERNPVSGNASDGIRLSGWTSENVIAGNYIGTDVTGAAALGNTGSGVWIAGGAHQNLIGTDGDGAGDAAERNVISGNLQFGISIRGTDSEANVVAGNFIGTDGEGSTALGNTRQGVLIYTGAKFNRVGTDANGVADDVERNVISGNASDGVRIGGAGADANVVAGNYIGTDVSGAKDLGNAGRGIVVNIGVSNTVGGTTIAARNVISGNSRWGIEVAGGATGTLIQGNYIGTDAGGAAALGNGDSEIWINASHSTLIGGLAANARNVISANAGHGVQIGGNNNIVQSNYVGVDATSTADLGNGGAGVVLSGGTGHLVGGNVPAARNVISGNDGAAGIYLLNPIAANVIAGNYIGTDVTGAVAVGNASHGVWITGGAHHNRIGTDGDGVADASEGNLITGNALDGVRLSDEDGSSPTSTSANVVAGNDILRNGRFGVFIGFGASDNRIGSSDPAARPDEANAILWNGEAGVMVGPMGRPDSGDFSVGNTIRGNRIYSNGRLGIDLGLVSDPDLYQGVTESDPGDIDNGANRLQNYPLLRFARTGEETYVAGSLNSSANTQFILDFYSNLNLDPGGHGEGRWWLGSTTVTTDGAGNATFGVLLDGDTTWTDAITTTATGPLGDTSEFSRGVALDQTRPTSRVAPLPARATSLAFPVCVTGSDPDAQGRITSGIVAFDVYVSVDGKEFSLWRTLPADAPSAMFTAQSDHSYGFRSVARDAAGNVESKGVHVEAGTYVPDLDPPETGVSAVDSATATFTVEFTGTDAGGSGLSFFDIFVQIDGGSVNLVGRRNAGDPAAGGVYSGSTVFQARSDGQPHTYRFFSVGLDGNNNVEPAPSGIDDMLVTATFAVPERLEIAAFDVQKGAAQRSYLRYLDLTLNQATGLQSLIDTVNDADANNDRIRLARYNLDGSTGATALSLAGRVAAVDQVMAFDFGEQGIGGNRNSTQGDGYYRLDLDLDGDGTFEAVRRFYRLLGDVRDDHVVDNLDVADITAAFGKTGSNLEEDVNGDGFVNAFNRTLAFRSRGRRLADGLALDD